MRKGVLENSTRGKILAFLADKPCGQIFNYEDFQDCGSYTCIRSSIVRVCETGALVRVAQGLFMKPYEDTTKMPSHLDLVNELARRVHAIAIPTDETKKYLDGQAKKKIKALSYFTNSATRRLTLYDGTVIQFYRADI